MLRDVGEGMKHELIFLKPRRERGVFSVHGRVSVLDDGYGGDDDGGGCDGSDGEE